MGTMSELELKLYHKVMAYELPKPELEYRFHPSRKWRFDMAFPAYLIAVEVEGGTWSGGRHLTPQGFKADCEKYNSAEIFGWTLLRFTREHIETDHAIQVISAAFAINSKEVKKSVQKHRTVRIDKSKGARY